MAAKLEGIVRTGLVDCAEEQQLCAALGVQRVPSASALPWLATRNPYKPKEPPTKTLIPFTGGDATTGALAKLATDQLPSMFITPIASANHSGGGEAGAAAAAASVASSDAPTVLLFTDKSEMTPLYKATSLRFRTRARFAAARADDAPLAALFGTLHAFTARFSTRRPMTSARARAGVTSAPTLLLTTPAGERHVFDGRLKARSHALHALRRRWLRLRDATADARYKPHARLAQAVDIARWLETLVAPEGTLPLPEGLLPVEDLAAAAAASGGDDTPPPVAASVVALDGSDFEALVMEDEGVSLVAFLRAGEGDDAACASDRAAWTAAAIPLTQQVNTWQARRHAPARFRPVGWRI